MKVFKKLLVGLSSIAVALTIVIPVAMHAQQNPQATVDYTKRGAPSKWEGKFKRGARQTPSHKMLLQIRFVPTKKALSQIAMVPTQLSYWLNNQVGDCVTAQEACSKGAWSVYCGLPDLFIPDDEVRRWASKNGVLDGADLVQVMDLMAQDGFNVNGINYKDGPHSVVDYSNEDILKAAICVGPVNIAIDANALPGGAGNATGWTGIGGSPGQFPNTDHCVPLLGYGPAGWLCQQLGIPLPAGIDQNQILYLLFTWNTIGLVDHAWLMSTTAEAHVRNPTTPGQVPNPNPVPPNPNPTPVPIPGTIVWNHSFNIATGDGKVLLVVTGTSTSTSINPPNPPVPTIPGITADDLQNFMKSGNFVVIIMDVFAIINDLKTKNQLMLIVDVQKLLNDLGIKATITPAVNGTIKTSSLDNSLTKRFDLAIKQVTNSNTSTDKRVEDLLKRLEKLEEVK